MNALCGNSGMRRRNIYRGKGSIVAMIGTSSVDIKDIVKVQITE
jgi:hypothetical protein